MSAFGGKADTPLTSRPTNASRGAQELACCAMSAASVAVLSQEFENETRDFVVLLVQSEMAGVEQMDLSIRQIASERLSPCRDERGIVPSPDHQGRRFVLA